MSAVATARHHRISACSTSFKLSGAAHVPGAIRIISSAQFDEIAMSASTQKISCV